jgi:hypothetical protein
VKKKIVSIIIISIIILCAIIIEYKIQTDESYHYGKDQGFFVRICSVCVLNSLFFFTMIKKHRFVFLCIGLLVGFISCLLAYLISLLLASLLGLYLFGMLFHILATILYLSFYFIVLKKYNHNN